MVRVLYLRAVCFAVTLFALYTFSAPAHVGAQTASTVQQAEIGDLERRAGANDVIVQKMQARIVAVENSVSEIKGEAIVFYAVISLLSGGSFVGQIVGQITESNRRKNRE